MALYGKELILDLIQCNEKVKDAEALKAFVKGLLILIDMKAYGEILLEHFGHANVNTAGFTFVQLIETSSLTAHISEKNQSMHLNIFSCKYFNKDLVLDYTTNYFNAIVKNYLLLERAY